MAAHACNPRPRWEGVSEAGRLLVLSGSQSRQEMVDSSFRKGVKWRMIEGTLCPSQVSVHMFTATHPVHACPTRMYFPHTHIHKGKGKRKKNLKGNNCKARVKPRNLNVRTLSSKWTRYAHFLAWFSVLVWEWICDITVLRLF